MSDICARLRAMAGPIVPNVCTEAADEIERLIAERDEARREIAHRVFVSGGLRPAELAESRGWDCFKEEGK